MCIAYFAGGTWFKSRTPLFFFFFLCVIKLSLDAQLTLLINILPIDIIAWQFDNQDQTLSAWLSWISKNPSQKVKSKHWNWETISFEPRKHSEKCYIIWGIYWDTINCVPIFWEALKPFCLVPLFSIPHFKDNITYNYMRIFSGHIYVI